jgi:hypothetical protein
MRTCSPFVLSGRYNRATMRIVPVPVRDSRAGGRACAAAIVLAAAVCLLLLLPDAAAAHGVTKRDAAFVQSIDGAAPGPFLYLGAKHMVTGYDHLLYIIDAIIGLSVVYKAFENMGGFERVIGFRPNTQAAVMIFGLFHGFGLATKLQEFTLPQNGLVANIISFNVGVEIGQVLALTAVLLLISFWRTRPGFLRHSFAANTALMTGGFILMGYQLTGYFQS